MDKSTGGMGWGWCRKELGLIREALADGKLLPEGVCLACQMSWPLGVDIHHCIQNWPLSDENKPCTRYCQNEKVQLPAIKTRSLSNLFSIFFSDDPLPPLIKTHFSSDAATFVYVNIFVRSFSKIDDVKMVSANISSQVHNCGGHFKMSPIWL